MSVPENFTHDWSHWVIISFFGLYALLFLIYMPLFIYLSKTEPLRSRFPAWTILGSIGSFLIFTSTTIGVFVDQHHISMCVFFFISTISIQPFVLLPPLIRVSSLWFHLAWNRAKQSKQKTWHSHYFKLFTLKYQMLMFLCNLLFFYSLFILTQFLHSSSSSTTGSIFFDDTCASSPGFALFFPRLLAFLLTEIPMFYFLFALRKVSDAYQIRNEIILLLIFHIPTFLIYSFRSSPNFASHFPQYFHPRFIYQVMEFLMFLVSVVTPVHMALRERSRMKKAGSDTNLSFQAKDLAKKLGSKTRREVFELVLGSPVLTAAFVNFCERSFCVENILFVLDIQKFKDLETRARLGASKLIIEHYFLKESPLLLNVDAGVIERVIEAYQQESDPAFLKNNKLFDEANYHVFDQLLRDPFQRWTGLSEFEDSLFEMMRRSTSSRSHEGSENPSIPMRRMTADSHTKVANGTQIHGVMASFTREESRDSSSHAHNSHFDPHPNRRSFVANDDLVLEEVDF